MPRTLDPARLADRVRRAREAAGLSQSQAAARMSPPAHTQTVSQVERGEKEPSLEWLYAFAVATGADPHALDRRLAASPDRLA